MLSAMARITGIGGVFFKSKSDHEQLAAWYARHLGLPLQPWGGAALRWSSKLLKSVTGWDKTRWIGIGGGVL